MVSSKYATQSHVPAIPAVRFLANSDTAGRAVLEDMEYQSKLPVLRHYVENRIASFAIAVSTYDTHALAALLQSVRVTLSDGGPVPEPLNVPGILAMFSFRSQPSLLTTTNLSIHYSGPAVRYTTTYQVWATGAEGNQLSTFGLLHGSFEPGPQVWKWAEHTIQPSNF